MSDTITYERRGHIGHLLLDNAKQHNALGRKELEAIKAAIERAATDEQLRVLVLTGSGEKTFCAGA